MSFPNTHLYLLLNYLLKIGMTYELPTDMMMAAFNFSNELISSLD